MKEITDTHTQYTIDNTYEVRVIFSDRGNNQVLGRHQEGYLVRQKMVYRSGVWYANKPNNIIIHFYNENNWDHVDLYYFQHGSYSSYWLGATMNYEKNNWYYYEIVGFEHANVIFSNRGNDRIPQNHQEIFSVSGEMWYKNGQWYTEEPKEIVSERTIKVHFYNENWSTAYIYYYSSEQTNLLWPGKRMINNGNGWFEYDIVGIDDPNIIFNDGVKHIIYSENNCLSEVNEVWYKDEKWQMTAPEGVVIYFYKHYNWNTPYIYYYITDNDIGSA